MKGPQPATREFYCYLKMGLTTDALLWHWENSTFAWSWPTSGEGPKTMSSWDSTGNPSPLGRGYLDYPSPGVLVPGGRKPLFFGSNRGSAKPEVLLSPAFPRSAPACSVNGTN